MATIKEEEGTENKDKEVSLYSLKDNDDHINALIKFYGDRGQSFDTAEEYLDEFMSEYRFIHTNTYGTSRFVNYLEDLPEDKENEEYLKNLGKLYHTIDTEVDQVFGDNTSLGDRASAVGQYALYSITDPVNIAATILGATGIGAGAGAALKAGATGLSRTAIKSFVNKALANKVARSAAVGAAVEAPIATYQEAELQDAEQEMQLRKGFDWGDLATSVAIRSGTAGAFGAAGQAILGKSAPKSKDVIKEMQENFEKSTTQGKAGSTNTLAEAVDEVKDLNTEGIYVKAIDTPESISKDYDDVGFIRNNQVDGKVTVRYLAKDSAVNKDPNIPSVKEVDYDIKDLKALTAVEADNEIKRYIKESGKFFDQDKVRQGKDFFKNKAKEAGISEEETRQMFEVLTDTDMISRVYSTLQDLVVKDPSLSRKVDLRSRTTEIGASILDGVNPEDLPEDLVKSLAANNIELSDLADFIRADASLAGTKLVQSQKISPSMLARLASPGEALGVTAGKAEDVLKTPEMRSKLRVISQQRAEERKAASRFGVGVDIWRSFMVTQPATTARNVLGSLARLPGEAGYTALNNFITKTSGDILGYTRPEQLSSKDALGIWKALRDSTSTEDLAKIIAGKYDEADRLIFQVFDDQLGREPDSKVGKAFNKASRIFNTLNSIQDRAFKTSGFMAELDNQVKLKRNRGAMSKADADKFDSIEKVIRGNRFDLIDDEMVSKSIQAAYRLTYQSRRAGDDLPIFSTSVNNLQRFLNSYPAIKLVMPFPNFMINSLVYTANRIPLVGILKAGKGAVKVRAAKKKGAKDALEKRAELSKISAEMSELLDRKPKGAEGKAQVKARIAELEGKADIITKEFLGREKALEELSRGVAETVEGFALLSAAYALKQYSGDGTIYGLEAKDGSIVDTKPMFPISAYMFLADTAERWLTGLPQRDTFSRDLGEFLGGPSLRGSPGRVIDTISDTFYQITDGDSDPEAFEKLGAIVGSMLGHVAAPFTTPLRPIQDVIKTVGGGESREFTDRRQQKGVLGSEFAEFNPGVSAAIDEFAKSLIQGTPAEPYVFSDVPEKYMPTQVGVAKGPSLPITKQVIGFNVSRNKGPVMKEINNLGMDKRIVEFRSNAPEYDNIANGLLAIAEGDLVLREISSEEYKNMSDKDKRDRLRSYYRGSNRSAIPSNLLKPLDKVNRIRGSKTHTNLKDITKTMLENEFPVLAEFKKYKDIPSAKRAKAINYLRKSGIEGLDILLKYQDEKESPEYAKRLSTSMELVKKVYEAQERGVKADLLQFTRRAAQLGQ